MKLTQKGALLADYWREFGELSVYKVLISGDIGTPLLITRVGGKTAGALIQRRESRGALVLLPHLNLWSGEFYSEVEEDSILDDEWDEDEDMTTIVWTEEGSALGHKLLHCLLAIDKALKQASVTTPPPNWVGTSAYVLPKEAKLREKLLTVGSRLEKLAKEKQELQTKIVEESSLRRLLYEKGRPLETAILQALKILGFNATPYHDSESEFDVVFDSLEGRLLGEAEGKDNKPVNVDKLRQLEMNIHEDFEREVVTEMAKGVLFGNAYRLRPLDERDKYFTEKCTTAANRSGTALVRTPDLFRVAQYLSNRADARFAKKCREAILGTNGTIVMFPEVPEETSESIVKKATD